MGQRRLADFAESEVPETDTFQCPTCERTDFDSRRALAIHHSAAHDESLPAPTTVCEICGDEFEVEPYRRDTARYCSQECMGRGKQKDGRTLCCEVCDTEFRVPPSQADDARFCSEECQNEVLATEWEGEQNPNWTGGDETIVCEWCGEEYDVRPAKADTSTFCSMACKGEAYAAWRNGEENPRWDGGTVTVTCDWCGEGYDIKPSLEQSTRYCGDECKNEAQTELTGQDNPNWEGGYTLYRAIRQQISDASWKKIREAETADNCRVCGTSDDLHLHHIVPLKRGGTNEPWNLITLCRTHHKHAEEFTKGYSPLAIIPERQHQ